MENSLSIPDIIAFAVTLAIPPVIGTYFAYADRGRHSTANYYFGDRKLHPVTVGVSSAVTCISTVGLIAYPAESYLIGTVFFWVALPTFAAAAIVIFHFIPLYRRLKLKTIYEFIELRFNRNARTVCALLVTLNDVFFMGAIVYLSSLALNAITPIPINWSIALTSLLCTFYTTLGGIKAVLWSDVMQSVVMLSDVIALSVCILFEVGGFGKVVSALQRGSRMTFFRTAEFDVSSRMDPVAIAFGEFSVYLYYLGFSQVFFQRVQSCQRTSGAQYSSVIFLLITTVFVYLSIGNGLLLYAYFEGCDPVKSGKLQHTEQMLPYMAMQVFRRVPCLTGLFIATLSCGALSTVSSALNSYSAVILEDFLRPNFPAMSERAGLVCGKIGGAIMGAVVMSISYVIASMDSNVFKTMRGLMGTVSGPVLGVYLLGMYLPWTNSTGAAVGAGFGYAFVAWIFCGANFLLTATPRVVLPPVTTDQCPVVNLTSLHNETRLENVTIAEITILSLNSTSSYTIDQMMYSINFHYYIFAGSLVTIAVGLITSFVTGANKPSQANPELFIPLLSNRLMPRKVRKFFRFGVPELAKLTSGKEAGQAAMHNDSSDKDFP